MVFKVTTLAVAVTRCTVELTVAAGPAQGTRRLTDGISGQSGAVTLHFRGASHCKAPEYSSSDQVPVMDLTVDKEREGNLSSNIISSTTRKGKREGRREQTRKYAFSKGRNMSLFHYTTLQMIYRRDWAPL